MEGATCPSITLRAISKLSYDKAFWMASIDVVTLKPKECLRKTRCGASRTSSWIHRSSATTLNTHKTRIIKACQVV
jgi:hypothetical protein